MRSDPRYLAIIPHHDGDNLPNPGPATPANLSLACSSSRSSLFLFSFCLSRDHFSRRFSSRRVFCLSSPLRIIPLISVTLPRGPSTFRLSLTRKLADPISTKLHCVSYLHAVASIYSVRSKLHAALSFPFYLPMHPIFHPHVCTDTTCGAPPSAPIHPADTKKICRRVSCLRLNDDRNNRTKKKERKATTSSTRGT